MAKRKATVRQRSAMAKLLRELQESRAETERWKVGFGALERKNRELVAELNLIRGVTTKHPDFFSQAWKPEEPLSLLSGLRRLFTPRVGRMC